jgi:hypothetical protein
MRIRVFRNPKGQIHVPMWSDDRSSREAMAANLVQFFHFVEISSCLFRAPLPRLDGKVSLCFRREEPLTVAEVLRGR